MKVCCKVTLSLYVFLEGAGRQERRCELDVHIFYFFFHVFYHLWLPACVVPSFAIRDDRSACVRIYSIRIHWCYYPNLSLTHIPPNLRRCATSKALQ